MKHFALIPAVIVVCAIPAFATDWPEFLGHDGKAHSADKVPTTWSNEKNLLWKVDLPGSGSSSPIITGDRLIVTCYIGEPDRKRQVICFNKKTGKREWALEYPVDYREDSYQGFITEHGYASNTPATDGKDVYVFLGKGGVHAISLDGKKKWSVDAGKGSSNRRWGSAASVVLFKDTVIINAAEESKAVFALNKKNGEEVWRQNANMLELTYGTPRLVKLDDGKQELVLSVPEEIWAMHPETGKLKWYASSPMTGNVSPSVIVNGTTIYSFGGYRSSGSIAVDAGGKGDVTSSQVGWTSQSSSYVATPLLHKDRFYWIDDRGIAYCTSAKNGELVYRERVDNLKSGRPVYASPVLIRNHIYVVTRNSGTIVYPPGDSFEPLAQNIFEGDDTDFNASPAVSENRLYLRSNKALYCIAEK